MKLNKKEYIEKHGEEAWAMESKRRNQWKKDWLARNPDKAEKRDKYFQDYREKHREEHKEYCAKYYEENKDAINEKKKEYNELNRDKIKRKKKEFYENNKEKILADRKEYRENNKEKVKEANRKWREDNKDYVKAKHQQYYLDNQEKLKEKNKERYDPDKQKEWWFKYNNTKRGKANHHSSHYKSMDLKKGLDPSHNVDGDWIMENIFNSSCIYCGDNNWKHLGCDRIDNTKPHTPDNIVCACGICNIERADKYSVEEFKEYRKTHPRDVDFKLPQEIVEINGKKVIKKVGN